MRNGALSSSVVKKLALGAVVISFWLMTTAFAFAEEVTSFTSDIVVEENGDLTVTETIVYDFGDLLRHGIYRQVSDNHAQGASAWYKERYIDLEPISVTRDGVPEPYVEESYSGMKLRIGDADRVIAGTHTYVIVYEVSGAISMYNDVASHSQFGNETTTYPDLVELYWNATGNEWEVPIKRAEVTIMTAAGVTLEAQQACYVGLPGSTQRCLEASKESSGMTASFVAQNIFPGQEFTVAQELSLPQAPLILDRVVKVWFWLGWFIVWFAGLATWIYRWRFKYRSRRSIIPQYEPYRDFKPMFTGVLFDNRLDTHDITAGIVYLAQQGYLKIKQTKDKVLWLFETTDYEVTVLKSIPYDSQSYEDELARLLFKVVSPGVTVRLSDLRNDASKQRINYATIKNLKLATEKELITKGFLEQRIKRNAKFIILFLCVWVPGFFGPALAWLFVEFAPAFIPVLLPVMIITVFAFVLVASERRTVKGYEALNHLMGFKDFLSVTEKERYKFHNAPDLSPEQFMEYLPYAIAFGVEKEWAKVFESITIPTPDWYESNMAGAHFSATAFTTDLASFASSFGSSTGSSGSSGSSGGGSSGGGSSGGGGGSW